jgi:hypothetical protein
MTSRGGSQRAIHAPIAPSDILPPMRCELPFLLLLALTGCSGVSAPEVDIAGASLGEVTGEGFVIDFAMNLANPNNQPLQLSEMRYSVSAEGATVYEGRRSAEATLSAAGQKTILVPAVVLFERIGSQDVPAAMSYIIRGELWYLAPGALAETLFDAGVQQPSVTFGGEGTIHFEGDSPAGD